MLVEQQALVLVVFMIDNCFTVKLLSFYIPQDQLMNPCTPYSLTAVSVCSPQLQIVVAKIQGTALLVSALCGPTTSVTYELLKILAL
jgi:hypothetical protein